MNPGQGPVAKTIYIGHIIIGKDSLQMYGQGPGSGQEDSMIGGYSKTLLDAASMPKKEFLKVYELKPSIGEPVWKFANAHQHEIRQMWQAYSQEEIEEIS